MAMADISDFMKVHLKKAEILYDKRALNAQKITGTEAELDEYEMTLFQQLVLHILQQKSQDIISFNEE